MAAIALLLSPPRRRFMLPRLQTGAIMHFKERHYAVTFSYAAAFAHATPAVTVHAHRYHTPFNGRHRPYASLVRHTTAKPSHHFRLHRHGHVGHCSPAFKDVMRRYLARQRIRRSRLRGDETSRLPLNVTTFEYRRCLIAVLHAAPYAPVAAYARTRRLPGYSGIRHRPRRSCRLSATRCFVENERDIATYYTKTGEGYMSTAVAPGTHCLAPAGYRAAIPPIERQENFVPSPPSTVLPPQRPSSLIRSIIFPRL